MVIDGCAPDLGCSLILRGGNEKTLIKIKKIVKYLIYVAYQLKLEAKFLADEFALPPPVDPEYRSGESAECEIATGTSKQLSSDGDRGDDDNDIPRPQVTAEESVKFQEVLKKIVLSSSPFCNYPLPYLLTEEGKCCPSRYFILQKIYWSRYLDGSFNKPKQLADDDCEWVENEDHVNSNVILKEPHVFTNPSRLMDFMYHGTTMGTVLNDFRARGGCIDLKMFRDYDHREKMNVFGEYLREDSCDELDTTDGWKKNKPRVEADDFLANKQPIETNNDARVTCNFL